jgi:hypothetical protein
VSAERATEIGRDARAIVRGIHEARFGVVAQEAA